MDTNKDANYYKTRPWTKYYPAWYPADFTPVYNKTTSNLIEEAVASWPDKTAINFYGKKISFKQLAEYIDRLAAALSDLGVKKGDTVGLLLLNSPQYVISYFAVLKIGGTVTPISPLYVSREIKHQVEDSKAHVIICQDILWSHVEKTGVNFEHVVLTNLSEFMTTLSKGLGKTILRNAYQGIEAPMPEVYRREGFHHFSDLLKHAPNPPKVAADPVNDVAVIQYTGGTTGLPRGAMLTHSTLVNAARENSAWISGFAKAGKECIVGYMPLYHVFGQIGLMLYSVSCGFTLILLTTPDMDVILSAIEDNPVTIFWGTPAIYHMLKDYEKTDRVSWKKFKYLLCAADALHEDTARDWERRTGTKIAEAYGLTECLNVAHTPPERIKLGSFGVPSNAIDVVAVADPDKNQFVPVGEVGELVCKKGPLITKGYWGYPQETSKAWVTIDGDQWFRTGDLVRMDEEGYFFFVDRKRDRIKYKGYSIFPGEIEEVLAGHPSVKDVAVVGVPDPAVGELIKAVVVLERDARGKISEGDLMKYCEENLAHYKIPKILEFRGEVPKTDIGKVSRREVREQ